VFVCDQEGITKFSSLYYKVL